MSVGLLAVCLIGGFALVRFLPEPALAGSVSTVSNARDVARAAWASTLSVLGNAMLWGAVAAVPVLAVERLINLLGGATVEDVRTAHDRVVWLYEIVGSVSEGLAVGTTILVAGGLLWWTHRRVLRAGTRAVDQAYRAEVARLVALAEHGELPPLPPSEAMAEVARRFEAVQRQLHPVAAEEPDGAGTERLAGEERVRLVAEADELGRLYHLLDLERRAQVSVDPAELGVERPRGIRDWIGTSWSLKVSSAPFPAPAACSRSP